jgi:hypothetical protein
MPRERTKQAIRFRRNMLVAMELRASGASFEQIGRALNPSVSRQQAWRGLDELLVECREKAESLRQLELCRLNRLRFALWPRCSEPRVVDTLLRISEREAKLLGLDAPQRVEASEPEIEPIQAWPTPDFSKLSLTEKFQLEQLLIQGWCAS